MILSHVAKKSRKLSLIIGIWRGWVRDHYAWELQTGQKDLEGTLSKILPVTSFVLQRKHIICVQEGKNKSTGFFSC